MCLEDMVETQTDMQQPAWAATAATVAAICRSPLLVLPSQSSQCQVTELGSVAVVGSFLVS